jgi:hypothetical protein
MAKKAGDPFMAELWAALVAAKLGPGGHDADWAELPVRLRNRFTRAVRAAMQSPAALGVTPAELGDGAA